LGSAPLSRENPHPQCDRERKCDAEEIVARARRMRAFDYLVCTEADAYVSDRFCEIVVDPLFASRTRLTLRAAEMQIYVFDVERPGQRLSISVKAADLRLAPRLINRDPPFQIGFDELQLSNSDNTSKACVRPFP
jgi:hypothetical protein